MVKLQTKRNKIIRLDHYQRLENSFTTINMKELILIILLNVCGAGLYAQTTKIPDFPDTGEDISNYPTVESLQGNPITVFDPNKTYIIEMWATWCIPCIAAMPYISELNAKFKDKGIVFIAQNVMEYDRDKVINFLKGKAELAKMNVAFSGLRNSEFELQWIKAAGINSIPQTIIIQGNKLLWQTTPYALNEGVLQLLVDH
jgi:thiol-disulfide isomerase/thioredoxin